LFVNSLFESASGFTTTGLSMITQPENLPQSFNFYRSYTQWVGGLSFVYLVMMLFFPEEKMSAWKSVLGGGMLRFKEFIVTLVGIFSAYLVILVPLLVLGGADAIHSISVVMAAITSGGFAPTSDFISPAHIEYLLVISLYISLSILAGSILSNTTGRSFEDGLFESASALSNTGLSAGITPLALDPLSKLMLTANMIAGRFEIMAILYIFFSSLHK
jgi:Trk-type K+ transport system membrane component